VKIAFEHVPREVNVVAHELARVARSSPSVWTDDPPVFILKPMLDDVTLIYNE
jgi:hypothetical protein